MKKQTNKLIILAVSTGFLSCKNNIEPTASAKIEATSNSKVSGTMLFEEKDGLVTMNAEIAGLPEGEHAIHIHEYGDCSAPDGTSAGGHWNPTQENHGKWGQPPFHRGDIGNISADSEGKGVIRLETKLWCIGCKDSTKNIVGKSIIIHSGLDDFITQPTGDAGSRIGCGEIVLNK